MEARHHASIKAHFYTTIKACFHTPIKACFHNVIESPSSHPHQSLPSHSHKILPSQSCKNPLLHSNKSQFSCSHKSLGSPSLGGGVTVYVRHKPTEFAHSFSFCSCFCFYLNGPFNCISFQKISRQLSIFSLCSSSLISASLVLLTIYIFMKASFSPDIIHSCWLGSKHQLTSYWAQNTN